MIAYMLSLWQSFFLIILFCNRQYTVVLFKAITDSGITFYIIDNMYVLDGQHRQINVVGRECDGKWKKYIDLMHIVNEYFSDKTDPFLIQ